MALSFLLLQIHQELLQKVQAYLNGSSQQPLVISGCHGYGKTTLMAASARYHKERNSSNNTCLVVRFLATSAQSQTISRTLYSICQQVRMVPKLDLQIEMRLGMETPLTLSHHSDFPFMLISGFNTHRSTVSIMVNNWIRCSFTTTSVLCLNSNVSLKSSPTRRDPSICSLMLWTASPRKMVLMGCTGFLATFHLM